VRFTRELATASRALTSRPTAVTLVAAVRCVLAAASHFHHGLLGEISTRRNRRDKHHIFPRALLSRHGFGPERFNSLLNICFLVARENQSIGYKAPRHYFADVPRSGRARNLALRSHLIPDVEDRGIWDRSIKRGFKTLLDARAKLVIRAFEEQADMRLFERR
jgi:hypothetical protein